MHVSLLVFRNFLYLKLAVGLVVLALVAYTIDEPLGKPNGGTWLGYTLGTLGALLIVWLTWFGIRKRRYGKGKLPLEDWMSAHVYLGIALLFIATLHSGMQFGWNVHTLAYGLMTFVILSGLFGLYAYIRLPRLRTENRAGMTLDDLMGLIAGISKECYEIAGKLDDEANRLVQRADQDTRVGGSVWRQLSGFDPHCATTHALEQMRERAEAYTGVEADAGRQLITLLARKVELLRRARRDVQLKAMLEIWLYIHIPMTIALLAALFVHIVTVFLYW